MYLYLRQKVNKIPLYFNSPLEQFDIYNLISLDLINLHFSITNIAFYLIISCLTIFLKQLLSNNNNVIISGNWCAFIESIYHTVYGIVTSQIKSKKGQIYFPFIYTLFIFILINNLISLIPYSFASTSHFILTFSLSFTIVFGATILGFQTHFLKFFSLFVPSGCPLALLPLLVIIETISYLARNVSLGLRLGANILSGHMLLSIISSFIYIIMSSSIIYFLLGLLPICFIIAFCALEFAIAVIQAQVFIVLSSSYINDSLELH